MTEITYDALVPLGRRLLCKPDPLQTTHGLIERPDTVYQRAHSGIIAAMGEDLPLEDRKGLKVGDHIGWGPHAGVEVRVRGYTHYLLDIDEPWGTIPPEAA
jgi:co-chaperonin GroES (HSP10)